MAKITRTKLRIQFTGYFVAVMSQGRHIMDTLDIAPKASALAVTRNGAAPSIPMADEVIEYTGQ